MSGDPRPLNCPTSCPVCKARFRGSALCSRCGADLTTLMLLAAHAHALRYSARQSLLQGDNSAALASVRAAQQLHATPEGNLLLRISSTIGLER